VREHYQNELERERNKLLKNFREGADYTISYEDSGKKKIYMLNSQRAKKAYFSGSLIDGMEYRLEESEKGFSARIVSPVFRSNQNPLRNNEPKIELIDEEESIKGRISSSQQDDEVERKRQKLGEEAEQAEDDYKKALAEAEKYRKKAEDARQKQSELENFTIHQQTLQKKW
jgi:hypothetical protein